MSSFIIAYFWKDSNLFVSFPFLFLSLYQQKMKYFSIKILATVFDMSSTFFTAIKVGAKLKPLIIRGAKGWTLFPWKLKTKRVKVKMIVDGLCPVAARLARVSISSTSRRNLWIPFKFLFGHPIRPYSDHHFEPSAKSRGWRRRQSAGNIAIASRQRIYENKWFVSFNYFHWYFQVFCCFIRGSLNQKIRVQHSGSFAEIVTASPKVFPQKYNQPIITVFRYIVQLKHKKSVEETMISYDRRNEQLDRIIQRTYRA